MTHTYVLALGSNRRHHRIGGPQDVVRVGVEALATVGEVLAVAPIIDSAPIGPSLRIYANSAVIMNSALEPSALLSALKAMERTFGRRRGQRWSARVLDVDIILWSGGIWAGRDLKIPHLLFRERDFVLKPAAAIAPDWRDPVTGLCVRHLKARLGRARRK